MFRPRRAWVGSLLALVAVAAVGQPVPAAEPAAPPAVAVSAIVPAEELAAAVEAYLEQLAEDLDTEQDFATNGDRARQSAHALTALVLVLANHDTDHPWKAKAARMLEPAKTLARAKEYGPAREAMTALEKEAASDAAAASLPPLARAASLGATMEEIALVNTRVRRNIRRFDRRADENRRDAVILAALAHAAVYDTHEVKDPAQLPQWYQWMGQLRDAAAKLRACIVGNDEPGAQAALTAINKACDDCHEVFHAE